jgi:hypothetical protein
VIAGWPGFPAKSTRPHSAGPAPAKRFGPLPLPVSL